MKKAQCLVLLIVAVLLPMAGFADDAKPAKPDNKMLPANTDALDQLLADSKYASRWQRLPPTATAVYIEDWSQPIADLRFQDASTIARVTRMRKLSLLTLAQSGQTRLFFGVNEKGVVGVHFSAFTLRGNDDYVELVRMPYLANTNQSSDVD